MSTDSGDVGCCILSITTWSIRTQLIKNVNLPYITSNTDNKEDNQRSSPTLRFLNALIVPVSLLSLNPIAGCLLRRLLINAYQIQIWSNSSSLILAIKTWLLEVNDDLKQRGAGCL